MPAEHFSRTNNLLSLAFVLFLSHSIIFRASFWCVVSLPLFGKTRTILPPKQTHQAAFSPAHTQVSIRLSIEKTLSISLSLSQSVVVCPFLVFSGRYIHTLYSSSSLVVWRSKSARGKIIVGETIRFFRDSFRARVSSVTLSWKRVDWRR